MMNPKSSSNQSEHCSPTAPRAFRPVDIAAALLAPAMILGLLLAYLIDPEAYLKWVINPLEREYQVVEILTFSFSASAGVLLLIALVRLWQHQYTDDATDDSGIRRFLRQRGGAAIILVIAVASLFLAGEEISWGQTYLGWSTPDSYQQISGETNLHNSDIPVQSLGSLFLLATFVGLPLWWWLQSERLPRSWAPAIPEWPVVTTVVIAFAWKEFKSIYRMFYSDGPDASPFYMGFMEQINEHKEMLAAAALLLYALYRLAAVARIRRSTSTDDAAVATTAETSSRA